MESSQTRQATPRVLLVEDHEALLRAWRRLLGLSFIVTDAVTTGAKALEAVAESQPDVVVLDLFLPDGNGFDLCERIRAVAPRAQIVIVTGHSDPDLPAAAKRAGASAIVQKLAPDADLEDVILGALSGRRWKDDGG